MKTSPGRTTDIPVRPEAVVVVVLAGGRWRRLGGGIEGLKDLGGRNLLSHVLARLPESVGAVILNANDVSDQIASFGLPIVPDLDPEARLGPLAGVLAGLEWASRQDWARWVLAVPSDAPFLPPDLLVRLSHAVARDRAPVAVAASAGRLHSVVGLWSLCLREDLSRALIEDGERKVGSVVRALGAATVDWPVQPHDPFLNINTPEDLSWAEQILDA